MPLIDKVNADFSNVHNSADEPMLESVNMDQIPLYDRGGNVRLPRISVYDDGGTVDSDNDHRMLIDGKPIERGDASMEQRPAEQSQERPAMRNPYGEDDAKRSLIRDDIEQAQQKGDLIGMGKGLLNERTYNRGDASLEARPQLPRVAGTEPTAPSADTGIPKVSMPAVSASPDLIQTKPEIPAYIGQQRIGKGTPGEAELKNERETKIDHLKYVMANGSREESADAQEQLARYEKGTPWGSPSNHPGLLGKIGHIASEVGQAALMPTAPYMLNAIPGTQRRLAAEEQQGIGKIKEIQAEDLSKAETGLKTAQTQEALQPKEPKELKAPEQAMRDLLTKVNPETKQLYTASEAYQKVKEMEQEVKPEKTVPTLTADTAKPYVSELHNIPLDIIKQVPEATKGETNGQKLDRLEKSFVGMTPEQAKIALAGLRQTGEWQVGRDAAAAARAASEKRAEDSASRKDIAAHDKTYVQPAELVEKSYKMMDRAYQEFEDARAQGKQLPTGAQSMVALSTHLATTFGNVKGARITKDMIQEHLGARGVSDRALVALQKFTNGDVLSPEQWTAFHELIGNSRNLSWETSVKEAERKHIPVDFLPDDLAAVKVPGHHASVISRSNLGAFHKKYKDAVDVE
jgi:hypothetical protein